MSLSFKNRIALYHMLATATITALVFIIIYVVAQKTMYQELDHDLTFEARVHEGEIFIKNDSILFINKNEWTEREHVEVQANPVFIQIVDVQGIAMDKSPNLKSSKLLFHSTKQPYTQFNTKINDQAIRQIQVPVQKDGILKGYILAAMSLEGANIVLASLRKTLSLLFPVVLILLFLITRFLAGRSIIPVQIITRTADRITRNSLNERIPLPANKDELQALTSSINELLDRMQEALEREKQFTADASHQLRTPLSVLKGTLEVLARKSRTEAEYRDKVLSSIHEIDRISEAVDQLLVLARLDKNSIKTRKHPLDLQIIIDDILQRYKSQIEKKELSIHLEAPQNTTTISDPYYLDIILENILNNAIKYSDQGTKVNVLISETDRALTCQIKNVGMVIPSSDHSLIFNPFYRSEALNHKEIKGNGLGLSIVKKACDALNIEIALSSERDKGTVFTLSLPSAEKSGKV